MTERKFVGMMTPETEKELGKKFKFGNRIIEIVDDPLIRIIDNKLFEPLMQKLPDDIQELIISALADVVNEMDEITIG